MGMGWHRCRLPGDLHLFGERTFDDTSAWSYEYNTSYALPEFEG